MSKHYFLWYLTKNLMVSQYRDTKMSEVVRWRKSLSFKELLPLSSNGQTMHWNFLLFFGGLYYFHRFANRETPCICNLNKLSVTTDNFFSHKEPWICLHFFLITNKTKTVITKQMCDKMKFNEQPQNIIL